MFGVPEDHIDRLPSGITSSMTVAFSWLISPFNYTRSQGAVASYGNEDLL